MPWLKTTDTLWVEPRVIAAGNEITGAYTRMLGYCAQQLTDGAVSADVAAMIAKPKLQAQIVERGFAQKADDGLFLPDYLDLHQNRPAEKVEEERAEARDRMAKAREERKRRKEEGELAA